MWKEGGGTMSEDEEAVLEAASLVTDLASFSMPAETICSPPFTIRSPPAFTTFFTVLPTSTRP